MSTLTQFFSASGGGGKWQSQTFTSSGTFTVPAGVSAVMVEIVGGGGKGSGGEIVVRMIPVTAGAGYAVTIGAGGTNVAGGNSTFGSILTARGGGGGGGAAGGVGNCPAFYYAFDLITVSPGQNFSGSTAAPGCMGYAGGQGSVSGGSPGYGGGQAPLIGHGGGVIGYGTGGTQTAVGSPGGGASYGNGGNTATAAAPNTGAGGGGGAGGWQAGGSGICNVYWSA